MATTTSCNKLQQQLASQLGLNPTTCSLEQILAATIEQLELKKNDKTSNKRQCLEVSTQSALNGNKNDQDSKDLNGKHNQNEEEGMQDVDHIHDEEDEGDKDEGVENWIDEFSLEEIKVSEEEMKECEEEMDGEKGNEFKMEWMISPLDEENFQETIMDQSCVLLRRPTRQNYYQNILSSEKMRNLMQSKAGELRHAYDVDVVRVGADGKRQNFGGCEGDIVDVEATMKLFDNEGCSIRLLHPQRWGEEKWCRNLWELLANLENQYACRAGCNVYWTPSEKQGFAAHYDDIDAFILQVEGSKYWKIYAPSESDVLDRFSSEDFGGVDLGQPIFEGEINPGNLLYMPRGTIHEARTTSSVPSLHVTVSMNQRCTYRDFLERHLAALWDDKVTLRRTIPSALFFGFMGTQNCDKVGEEIRQAVVDEIAQILCDPLSLNATVDSMIAEFQSIRLPMPLPDGAKKKHQVDKNTFVKTTIEDAARMLPLGEGEFVVAHCLKNSFTSHCVVDNQNEKDEDITDKEGWIRFPVQCAEVVENLLGLDDWLKVGDIEVKEIEMKDEDEDEDEEMGEAQKEPLQPVSVVEIVQKLVDEGVLLVKE